MNKIIGTVRGLSSFDECATIAGILLDVDGYSELLAAHEHLVYLDETLRRFQSRIETHSLAAPPTPPTPASHSLLASI